MKYLFSCTYDNETYQQREDDISRTFEDKSAYYDIKDKKIKKFWLTGEGKIYGVDLETGEFEANGAKFKLHDENLKGDSLRLIYHRRHTHQFQGTKEVSHTVEFQFGWQTTDQEGKNHKYIMRVE